LSRSRVDPNEEQQYIETPLLNYGVGDLFFNYKVTKGTIGFEVRLYHQNGLFDRTLYSTVVSASPDIHRCYVPALSNFPGRLRIRIIGYMSSPDAVMLVDNLKATNYPRADDSAWEAYNMRISDFNFDGDYKQAKFDGAAATDMRGGEFNNAYDADTPYGIPYDSDLPYLQSPRIITGIGEVSFWYRVSPGSGSKKGRLILKGAPYDTTPKEEWYELGVIDLDDSSPAYAEYSSNITDLSNIDNENWRYFTAEFFNPEFKVLRIYADIDDSARVMIDNVVITEPVRTSLDIGYVELIPEIPWFMDDVGVKVRLVNPRMNPMDIKVFLQWYPGTNVWGRANWPSWAVNEVQLLPNPGGNPYMFYLPPDAFQGAIPKQPVDSVVQYTIRVEYTGKFASPVWYDKQFQNPPWYEPVDLNALYGNGYNRTPYYFVLSTPADNVFINEFLPFGFNTSTSDYYALADQFVELVGVNQGDISGWKLEHIDISEGFPGKVFWTNIMPPGSKFTARYKAGQSEETKTNNWGTFVLANAGVHSGNPYFNNPDCPVVTNMTLFPAHVYNPSYTGPAAGYENPVVGMDESGGAMVLRNSMGAYVDRIVWGDNLGIFASFAGTGVLADFENAGFKVVPRRPESLSDNSAHRPVGLANVNGKLEWVVLPDFANLTPGYMNPGQEELMWYLPPFGSSPDIPVEPGAPVIRIEISKLELDATPPKVWFTVRSLDENVALEAGQYGFYLMTSKKLVPKDEFAYADGIPHTNITAPDTGVKKEWWIPIPSNMLDDAGRFFIIKAVVIGD